MAPTPDHIMDLNKYQESAVSFAMESAYTLKYLVPGFLAEAGEVAGKLAKAVRDGEADPYDPSSEEFAKLRQAIKGELGDCLWFLAVLGDIFFWSLEDLAAHNLEKLGHRKAKGTIGGSGDER